MEYLAILGALANTGGALVYVWDVLKGRSQPNLVSFFLWSAAPFIGTAAALAQGVTWAALPVFTAGFGPFLVLLASFYAKKKMWRIRPFDWFCGLLSVAALVLWQITKNPNVALVFAILSDLMAALPTIKKSWTHPETETVWIYLAGIFAAAMGLLAAKAATFSEISFPAYLLVVNGVVLMAMRVSGGRHNDGSF